MTICIACQDPGRAIEFGLMCGACERAVARDLAVIPVLVTCIVLVPSQGDAGPSSGKPSSSPPLSVDALDLTMPARAAVLTRSGRDWMQDQTGRLSAASVLDAWVAEWRVLRGRDEHAPAPTVPSLCRWLADRLGWACTSHPAVDEFARDMRDLRAQLAAFAGRRRDPDRLVRVPCPECDLLALVRLGDGTDRVRCGACGVKISAERYALWTKLLNADRSREERP